MRNYQYAKMHITKCRYANSMLQLADIRFADELGSFFQFANDATCTFTDHGMSGSEGPDKLIDNDAETKMCYQSSDYANYDIVIDFGSTPLDIDIYTKWQWYTANDATDRDPVSFEFYISQDGSDYTKVSEEVDYDTTTTRNTFAYEGNMPASPTPPTPPTPPVPTGMIYTVKMQADRTQQWVDIYGPTKELSLLSPKVKVELNSAGSFTFVLPPNHTYYSLPKILLTNVAVWEENNLIFFGRVSEIEVDFYKQKTIHAEGALAFLNDTIQRPAEWEVTSVRTFVNYILAQHNNQVPSDRRIQLHHVDDNIGNKTVYRKLDYETTFDALKKMCLEAEGGYLFINVAIDSSTGESTLTMDWLEGLETSGNEPIQYAVNLVDLKQTYGIEDLYTAVIPLGKETDGVKLTIASVNSGLDYLLAPQSVINEFGTIYHVENFNDIDNATKLKTEGQAWLARQNFDSFAVEVSAAELHFINSDYNAWKIGQNIRVLSSPHLIDKTLPLTKLDIDLSKAVKQVTVGTKKKETLTEIYKDKTKEYVK